MEDFRVAMLDPERYALSPSIVPTPGPLAGYGGETISAQPLLAKSRVGDGMVLDGGTERGTDAAPMPSTFRDSAVAVEADEPIPKSRGALLAGILVAALAAGGVAAFLVVRAGSGGGAPTVQPAVSNPAPVPPRPPTVAPLPAKVILKFRSQPGGAAVARKDTGEQLGVTPFEIEVPQGNSPLAVIFKKPDFKDVPLSIVPSESGFPEATLEATPPAVRTTPERTAKPSAKPGPGKTSGARRGKGGRPMDEDGVLAPSF